MTKNRNYAAYKAAIQEQEGVPEKVIMQKQDEAADQTIMQEHCLYRNLSGITMPLFCLTTAGYCFYCMKQLGIHRKKGNFFYIAMMILLGISDVFAGSLLLIFCNNTGIFLLLICMPLHNYFSVGRWTLFQYLRVITDTITGAVISVFDPYLDAISFHNTKKVPHSRLSYVLLGLLTAIPLLSIIIELLYSADAVFASMLCRIGKNLVYGDAMFQIIAIFLFAWMSAYCGLRFLGKYRVLEAKKHRKQWEPAFAVTILALLTVVYIVFCVIQAAYLFWGRLKLPLKPPMPPMPEKAFSNCCLSASLMSELY